jgi:hypothetical protein
MSSKKVESKVNVAGLISKLENDKVDIIESVDAIMGAHTWAEADGGCVAESFVFSIGAVRPKEEPWMQPFVQRAAGWFGCEADVSSVVKGIATFRLFGRKGDVQLAVKVVNATITRVHHDAWRHVNSAKKSEGSTRERRYAYIAKVSGELDVIKARAVAEDVAQFVHDVRTSEAAAKSA